MGYGIASGRKGAGVLDNSYPHVLQLRLKNFKSFPGAVINLEPMTILVGPNGAGKSNILDALGLLSDAMRLQLRTALDARGGVEMVRLRKPGARRAPRFGVSIHMQIQPYLAEQLVDVEYGFEAKAIADHGYVISRERCHITKVKTDGELGPGWLRDGAWFERTENKTRGSWGGELGRGLDDVSVEHHALLLPVLSGLPLFSEVRDAIAAFRSYSISPSVIRDLHDPAPGYVLEHDGANITSVIAEMQKARPDDHKRLCEFLGRVVPGITSVESVSYGPKKGLQFTQEVGPNAKPLKLEASSMSDGTLRVLGILAAVFQRPRPVLMAIEEPEATIHPGALATLMDILRQQGNNPSQIVITTHSPDILDIPDLAPDAIKLVQWVHGASFVAPIGQASYNALEAGLSTVGELLRSNFLRPEHRPSDEEVDLFPEIRMVDS